MSRGVLCPAPSQCVSGPKQHYHAPPAQEPAPAEEKFCDNCHWLTMERERLQLLIEDVGRHYRIMRETDPAYHAIGRVLTEFRGTAVPPPAADPPFRVPSLGDHAAALLRSRVDAPKADESGATREEGCVHCSCGHPLKSQVGTDRYHLVPTDAADPNSSWTYERCTRATREAGIEAGRCEEMSGGGNSRRAADRVGIHHNAVLLGEVEGVGPAKCACGLEAGHPPWRSALAGCDGEFAPGESAVSGSGARDLTAEHDYFDKWQAAEERATSAEQERDEAKEYAAGYGESTVEMAAAFKTEVERLQGELAGARTLLGRIKVAGYVNSGTFSTQLVQMIDEWERAALAPQEGAEKGTKG